MNTICKISGLSKHFGKHHVLEEINISVQEGEMVAITGKSGSGKTTLLNMIGMLEQPDSGNIELFGESIPRPNSIKARQLLKSNIAYLFQNFALIDNATVEANLEIALMYSGKTRAEKICLKQEALSQVGLNISLRQKIHELSGGEQQRVSIARILLKPCDLVLADEPTGSLDENNRDCIIRLLQMLNERGKTLIIVTHDQVVAKSCNRIINLS
ncbi:ABC transporter ATP-binding protein [Paenibacillus zanthoxyli]|uniref:ABC transporter ATP-binding protein n=1 Tax=Paenibacillus zanthoxyli TaxID=369399 RepID=UPI00047079B7|nr:ABC transporter ATP-binding protein [Paenibacillus zanthoxyli]